MPDDNAFGEGLAKLLDGVATVKVTQSRRLGQGAFVRAPNGVASAAVALGDGLSQGKRFARQGSTIRANGRAAPVTVAACPDERLQSHAHTPAAAARANRVPAA